MWDVLAIAPTDDAKAIRRAYAARLREIDPDRDREAFARLRAALEWALSGARRVVRQAPARPSSDELPEAPRPSLLLDDQAPRNVQASRVGPTAHIHSGPPASGRETAAEIANERAQEQALLMALESALQRRDAREAAPLYFRAAATGAVPLGYTERMLVRLFTVALDDGGFDGAAFRGLTKTLGWDQPQLDSAAVSAIRQRVLARLAAEDWYDDLVAVAERKKSRTPRLRAKVARLILHRIGGVGLWRINRPTLRQLLDQLKPHEVWLRDRIPSEWIAILENRMRCRELIVSGIAILFVGGLLLNSLAVLTLAWLRDGFSQSVAPLGILAALLAWLLKVLVFGHMQRRRQRVP